MDGPLLASRGACRTDRKFAPPQVRETWAGQGKARQDPCQAQDANDSWWSAVNKCRGRAGRGRVRLEVREPEQAGSACPRTACLIQTHLNGSTNNSTCSTNGTTTAIALGARGQSKVRIRPNSQKTKFTT